MNFAFKELFSESLKAILGLRSAVWDNNLDSDYTNIKPEKNIQKEFS